MTSVPALNTKIAGILKQLATLESSKGETHKAKAFTKAAGLISKYPGKISSGKQAKEVLDGGIGPSTMAVIDDVIKTGSSARLEASSEREKVITHFMQYYEIGEVAAARFYDAGYRTAQDLLSKADLTRAQRLGLEWYPQISQKIPRAEIDRYVDAISGLLDQYGVTGWYIGGSYARGAASSGDIDLLVQAEQGLDLNGLILILSPLLLLKLEGKASYFRGIASLTSPSSIGRRIDIAIFQPDEVVFALLHSIGSGPFNELMRRRARDLGYKLNQTGLYKGDQKVEDPEFRTDRDIFDFLGIEYVEPSKRTEEAGLILIN